MQVSTLFLLLFCIILVDYENYNNNTTTMGLPWCLRGKESDCQCRIYRCHPWVGKRSLGEGKYHNPLQYSFWENLMREEPGGLHSMGSQSSQ